MWNKQKKRAHLVFGRACMGTRSLALPLLWLMLLCATGVSAAPAPIADDTEGNGIVSVIFYLKDGTQIAYAMDDHPRFSFMANNRFVMLRTDMESVAYQVTKLDKFVFSDDPTAVMPVSKPVGGIVNKAGTLLFAGFAKAVPIKVCDTAGRTLLTSQTDEEGSAALSLAALPRGVYIVSAGDANLKVKK